MAGRVKIVPRSCLVKIAHSGKTTPERFAGMRALGDSRCIGYLSGEPTVRHLIDTYANRNVESDDSRKANATAFRRWRSWLRGADLNRRPLGYAI